jgi:hypothetical protein
MLSRDDAFKIMLRALKDVLPDVETYARHAKNAAARRAANARANQVREAIQAAEEAA